MPHVLIIHEVEAYPAWKAVFDGAADLRKRAGEISYQLLRYDQDANHVVHFLGLVFVRERSALLRVPGVGRIEASRRREGAGLSVSGRDRARESSSPDYS
jgi:hypothetical protein